MDYDDALLRVMIASPDDATPRLIYADWLEDGGDPRAELLRSNWDVPRLSFVDWIARQGNLNYYLQKFPELQSQANEHDANRWWRKKLKTLESTVNRDWIAVVDTLGRPFRPFFFWNNTGPRAFQEGELPFLEQIGTRGPVITFESAFRGSDVWQPGLDQDLGFLCRLRLGDCEYGAASCPIHPFLCELEAENNPLSGADVLRALKTSDFRCEHVQTLDAPTIPFPGYQPGTDNDEIHNDSEGQYVFPHSEDVSEADDEADGPAARQAVHDALRAEVVDGRLWYVLLHNRAGLPTEDFDRGPWVVLFAVGRSLRGSRLIGVVSHQACHNLCD